ncbi:hypothetical protein [Nocardia spumae]|uniref:hypothetical protein n=1 Tax=Nocardia spumae TaxID=2887190 RepID=UPI001D150044|nr:hypothetical protein [Nocardia spumae]
MAHLRNFQRPALVVSVFAAMGAAVVSLATAALADNSIKVDGVGPANVAVQYSCDPAAGVTAIKAMTGDPAADRPSATGTQDQVTCDGSPQKAVITLTGAELAAGQRVQVRVALVDPADTVVSGYANVFTLGQPG